MNPSTDTREDIKPTVTRAYVDCPATQSVNVITIITTPGMDTVQCEMLLFGPFYPDIYCKFLIPDDATEEVKQEIQARNSANDVHWNEQVRRRMEYTQSPESRIAYAKAYFKDEDNVMPGELVQQKMYAFANINKDVPLSDLQVRTEELVRDTEEKTRGDPVRMENSTEHV